MEQDRIVAKHLDTLYQTMLEQNLCRIIEPYKRVQVRMTINSGTSIVTINCNYHFYISTARIALILNIVPG